MQLITILPILLAALARLSAAQRFMAYETEDGKQNPIWETYSGPRPTLDDKKVPRDSKCQQDYGLVGCCYKDFNGCENQNLGNCDTASMCPKGVVDGSSNGTPACKADCCSTTTGRGMGCPK